MDNTTISTVERSFELYPRSTVNDIKTIHEGDNLSASVNHRIEVLGSSLHPNDGYQHPMTKINSGLVSDGSTLGEGQVW